MISGEARWRLVKIRAFYQLPGRPAEGSPGKDVQVKVVHALPDRSAAVDDHPVAAPVARVVRDLAHHVEEPAADTRVRKVAEARDVLARDHEGVEGRLRRAVLEGHHVG